MPARPSPALAALAGVCVIGLDRFRAPPTPEEIARRGPRPDPVARAHLARWGYPWVLDRFRFHMTLTGALPPDEGAVLRGAGPTLGPLLAEPVAVTALCHFAEGADGRFRVLARYPLEGGRQAQLRT